MADTHCASTWLRRNNLRGVGVTPVLTERLAARRHAARVEVTVVGAGLAILVVLAFLQRHTGTGVTGLVLFTVTTLVLVLGAWLGMRTQRRAERKVAATMRTRVTHPGSRTILSVLGRWYAGAAAVIYGAGLVLGLWTVVTMPGERTPAVGFTVAVAVLAVIAATMLTDVVRRPTLAAGSDTLAVDDALRAADARRAATPYPVTLAIVVGVAAQGTPLLWLLTGYGMLAAMAWGVAEYATKRAAR
jgi:hypothetical protein